MMLARLFGRWKRMLTSFDSRLSNYCNLFTHANQCSVQLIAGPTVQCFDLIIDVKSKIRKRSSAGPHSRSQSSREIEAIHEKPFYSACQGPTQAVNCVNPLTTKTGTKEKHWSWASRHWANCSPQWIKGTTQYSTPPTSTHYWRRLLVNLLKVSVYCSSPPSKIPPWNHFLSSLESVQSPSVSHSTKCVFSHANSHYHI